MEKKHCNTGSGEEARNFLHRNKRKVGKPGLMIRVVSKLPNKMQSETLQDDKEDKDILTFRRKIFNLDA